MSNNQREARNTREQITTTAIDNLINKTSTKFGSYQVSNEQSARRQKSTMWTHCWRKLKARSNA